MAQQLQSTPATQQVVLPGEAVLSCRSCDDVSISIRDGVVSGEGADDLFICSMCDGSIFCEDCGTFIHRKNKKGHRFDLQCSHVKPVRTILTADASDEEISVGHRLVRALVGAERWKRSVSPMLSRIGTTAGASVGGLILLSDLMNASGGVLKVSSKLAANGAGIATAAVAVVRIACLAYRWHKREISAREFVRSSGKVLVTSGASFGGVAIGAKIGAAVGTAVTPGVGTAVGIVLGVIIGGVCGLASGKLYDKLFPDGEQAERNKQLKLALLYFHLTKADLSDEKKFNKKVLSAAFRRFALQHHPDRTGGDEQAWATLCNHYAVLQGVLDEQTNKKYNTKLIQKALTKS